ncbi:MAG TPA: GGDEF domain-containing protein [Conexibacter sp.]
MANGSDTRLVAHSAAAIYAGAAALSLVQIMLPGGEAFSPAPAAAALVVALAVALAGPRAPRWALAPLAPLGVALIGAALADTHEYSDGALLYIWPALWAAYFFGDRGAAFVVLWTGLVHALALVAMPAGHASADRWIDVEVGVLAAVAVVRVLIRRNERLVQDLVDQARIDPLTGLLNRRGFEERLDIELARAIRDASSLAVVVLDLDRFKDVNDTHGHEVGDRVLTWIGAVLTEHVRGVDVAARLGGDEFVVALPRTDVADALHVAERVRAAVANGGQRRARFGVGDELSVTVSGGVAAHVGPIDLHALLADADRALYAAKHEGRSRVLIA